MNATTAAATKASHDIPAVPKHYHCYLLTSLSPAHPHKTYIGYTTNPHRRLRQHNGILKSGGAWRTKRSGRPWSFACVLSGFSSSTAALKFEWAWQHPSRSLIFKSGCPGKSATVAKGLERRRGVKAKLDLMKVLVCASEEYKGDPLTVHFLEQETKEIFEGLLQEQRQRRLDLDEEEEEDNNHDHHHSRWCEELPRQMKLQVIDSVEEMPFFVETMKLRQKKRRRKATQRQSKRRNRIESSCSNNDNDDDGDVNNDDDDESNDHSEEDSITSHRIGQKESHDSTVSTSNILQDIVNLSLDEHARHETQRNTTTRFDRIRPTSLLYSSDSSSGKSINLLDDSDHSDDCMDIVSSDNSSSSDGTIDLTTNREIKTPDRIQVGSQHYDCDVGSTRRIQDEMMDCPIDLISPIPIAASSRVLQHVFYNEDDSSCNSDGTIDLCSP